MTHDVRSGATAALFPALAATICLAIATAGAGAATAASATAQNATNATALELAPARRAHAARVLNATDTVHLHYISASGSLLFEEGKATGTLPGSMRIHLNVGTTFTGNFTIYAGGGTIQGHGSATPHGSGTYESFSGTLTVTGGSGRYAHAHGHGGMSGTFDRDNYALVIKTTGSLTY
jgi:hypothetical protein